MNHFEEGHKRRSRQQKLIAPRRSERVGLHNLALPRWKSAVSIEKRADGISCDRRVTAIVLHPQESMIAGADVPIRSARVEHVLAGSGACLEEVPGARN